VSLVEFGELVQFIRNGMNVKQDKSEEGIPITRIETISDSVINPIRVGYAGLSEELCKDWLLQPGDILFSHINSINHIGKCAVYHGIPSELVHGMNLLCFRCDSTKLIPEYAKYMIRGQQFRSQLSKSIKPAVNQASVSISDIKDIRVSLPSLPEQKRIAAILDKADELRAKRRATIAQLDELGQAIFLEMFGDPATNPKGWPKKTIAEISTVITGNTPSRHISEYFGHDIEWIKSDNINTPNYYLTHAEEGLSTLGKQVARTAPTGSILVTCIAGSPKCLGNAAMTDREVAFNQQINAVIPTTGNVHFIYAQILAGKQLIQQASTAGMKGMVNKTRFEQVSFIWPPISMQEQFAHIIKTIEEKAIKFRASLNQLDTLFSSLQHKAFEGGL
jgi:type I restriction enzyme, S subunit